MIRRFTASRTYAVLGLKITKIFFPDTILLRDKDIFIIRRSLLGMLKDTKTILYKTVSSFDSDQDILFASLKIETTGGSVEDIKVPGLYKRTADHLIALLTEKCNETTSGQGED